MTIRKKDDFYNDVFEKFLTKFILALKIEYSLGSSIALVNAKQENIKTSMKPLAITKKDESVFIDTMTRLIKGANEDISKRINTAINDNILNKSSKDDLTKNIKDIFNKNSSDSLNYKNRYKTIARTESTRVLSVASQNTAKRIGASKKYLSVVEDERTSCICGSLFNKYGTPEQAIDINSDFKTTCNGKQVSTLLPPFHVNCRTIVLYDFD